MSGKHDRKRRGSEADAAVAGARAGRGGLLLLIAAGFAVAVVFSIFVGVVPPVLGLVAIGVVLSVVFWLIRAHLPAILLVFVAVLLAGTVITRRSPKLMPD